MALIKLISNNIDSVNQDVSLQEILNLMIKNKTKHFVLLDDKKPIGIITERDILVLYTKHIDLSLKAINYAKKCLITSKSNRKIDYILGLMLNHRIRRVLIVDFSGNYLGTILQEKLIYKFEQDIFKTHTKAKDLIRADLKAIFVQKNATIQTTINLMSDNHLSSILIFDNNKPIGILTESDIINLAQKHIDTTLNIQEVMHRNIICFNTEDLLFYVVDKMRKEDIRRAVIFDKIKNDYFIITSKDILNNIKGNYNLFLESKLRDIKSTFNSLNEAVIELFDNEEEQVIYWFNQKAKKLFNLSIDDNITTIIPKQKWNMIYKKILADDYNENEIIEINDDVFQLTVINTVLLDSSIIKLLFTNITEISNTNTQIENKFRFLYEQVPYPYQSLNEKGIITNVNKKWTEITGYTKDEAIGKRFITFTDEKNERLKILFKDFLNNKKVENERIKIKKKNGEIILVEFNGNISNINGELKTHCMFKDITREEKIQKKLKLSDIVFENTTEGILITNEKNEIISVNNAFTKITGYEKKDILYKNPNFLSSNKHHKEFYQNLWEELISTGQFKGEIWNRKKSGEIYPEWLNISIVKDSAGNILNYVAIFSDITKIKKSNEKIEYLAHHDPLTNLPNRLLLKARLDQSITHANTTQEMIAVFFIDIDNFKVINDTYGHSIGDKIINLVATRLQRNLRENDTISRIGGDEFIIVIENIDNIKNIEKIASKLLADFKDPVKLQEYLFDVTISIGISLFPNNSLTTENLIKHADTAMYSAKNAGRNQFQFYKDEMTSEIFEKILMKKEISDALENGDFEVYYQPQINIKENKIVGLEALVRWNYRNTRLVFPDEFISHAEETKLIIPLGEFVLKSACLFLKKLQDLNLMPEGIIAVNISSIQIKNCDILKVISKNLNESGLDAKYLEIELTESYIMENIQKSLPTLHKLKDLGIKLAIDDFGTGYSSLSYLKKFPIDKLKIDKSFINELPNNPKDVAITRTIIALAKGLEMKTIAEGVELQKQKDFLEQEDCDEIQGWLYSKALRANDFIEFVKNFK
ncbi:MAG: EAL domain-containing protein [Aliarcobacter sp.]|jgi:diguanylate cyclase (GGDEF)-like protein/PAS domain S-box-containing protein|nr:EAL domain-containing protein [Aliarcobacter sp.]